MLFIGNTRFSLFNPRSSSWKATNGRFTTPEAYEAYLYSDSRMGVRCKIFIEHSLPQLEEASRGHDIFHVVSYSANLPRKYQDQLEAAAQRYPFLGLDRHEDGRIPTDLDGIAQAYFAERPFDIPVYGTYRLDDDDLLSADFFDQMAQHMRPDNIGMQVSLAAGFTALYEDGVYSNVRETHWPMLAIGLLQICGLDDTGLPVKPIHAPHHLSDRSNPVILDSRKPSYLWVRHVDQDTAMDFTKELARANVLTQMAKYKEPGIDVNIREVFPRLSDSFKIVAQTALVEKATPVAGVLTFPFDGALSEFKISVDAEFGDGVVDGNALFSLDLTTSDGYPLTDSQRAALASFKVATSANESVGHYRYLDTKKGRAKATYDFALPNDVVCHGVRLRHWKKPETPITLHAMAVQTEN